MRSLSSVLLCLTLTACATTAGYEKRLNTWVGKEELDLVRAWGPPTSSFQTAGRRFLVYSASRDILISGNSASLDTYSGKGGKTYVAYTPATPDRVVTASCTTQFELVGNRINGWSHKGDDCRARE